MADYSFDSLLSDGFSIGQAWVPPSGSSGSSESGGILDGLSSLVKGAMGSANTSARAPSMPVGYSSANSGGSNVFDSSGWTVATGKSSASGAPAATQNPWLIGAAVLAASLVLIVWLKK